MLVGWYSEVGEQQDLGALLASKTMLTERRAAAGKFTHAYRRGAADYSGMVRLDRYGKRISNVGTRELATVIARYVFPGRELGRAAGTVETGAYPMDPQARLNTADLQRQVAWLKEQKLIDASVNVPDIVDTTLGTDQ
jgi:hypothetical protein